VQISYSFQGLIYFSWKRSRIILLTPVILNTTLFFAKGQGRYLRQKLFLLDSIYNKADIGIGIADPIVRIEVTETGISTIISVAANEECLLLICLTNTKVKK
jgi:hypothetical protein